MDTVTPRIILASSSPRRKALLQQIHLSFDVIASHADEHFDHTLPPEQTAEALALRKAQEVAGSHPDAIVIGADTIVLDGGQILGKPRHEDDAFRMLSRLSNKEHRVITGLALLSGQENTFVRHESTRVKLAALSPQAIQRYIDSGEPMGKAGAYAIQGRGAIFIEWIHGCYNNVVGLPLFLLNSMLEELRDSQR
ncbi:hypothetical protein CSB45_04260 [candidate division KSB3 bacterium]|uniref:dTTP/UTP pyrophosphatase n=1 Tax=candidate division KSB3 bacterium TaxID=2044937 RepID=A0A2G6E8L4_9BACT|nr:MAG: hypothetical protein CSB45_04260 [candidate division KSB3 bacterium]PIE30592.1 MAG: hypothetical protein CSA57_02845 [candidate division KSB3 bacterium]